MKTKIAIILFAAITLLSFTLASSKAIQSQNHTNESNGGKGGFELQDQDQF